MLLLLALACSGPSETPATTGAAASGPVAAPAPKKVAVALRPEDKDMPLLPWIDPANFNPGYMMRGMHLLPKRGEKPEWQHNQDYWAEKDEFPAIDLKDRAFVYG